MIDSMHDCFVKMNAELRASGRQLKLLIATNKSSGKEQFMVQVSTERGRFYSRTKPVVVPAHFCPFCGVSMTANGPESL